MAWETKIRTGDPATDQATLEAWRRNYAAQGLVLQASPLPDGGLYVRALPAGVVAAPMPAPQASPALPQLQVGLGAGFIAYEIFMGLITLGVTALITHFFITARWPRVIDPQGVTLRSGKRLAWKDLTDVNRVRLRIYGARAGGRVEFLFGKEKMIVVPVSLDNGRQALACISQILGRDVTLG
jgi:hypothetical protein